MHGAHMSQSNARYPTSYGNIPLSPQLGPGQAGAQGATTRQRLLSLLEVTAPGGGAGGTSRSYANNAVMPAHQSSSLFPNSNTSANNTGFWQGGAGGLGTRGSMPSMPEDLHASYLSGHVDMRRGPGVASPDPSGAQHQLPSPLASTAGGDGPSGPINRSCMSGATSQAQGPGLASMQSTQPVVGNCWHEITAVPFWDPETGQQVRAHP